MLPEPITTFELLNPKSLKEKNMLVFRLFIYIPKVTVNFEVFLCSFSSSTNPEIAKCIYSAQGRARLVGPSIVPIFSSSRFIQQFSYDFSREILFKIESTKVDSIFRKFFISDGVLRDCLHSLTSSVKSSFGEIFFKRKQDLGPNYLLLWWLTKTKCLHLVGALFDGTLP